MALKNDLMVDFIKQNNLANRFSKSKYFVIGEIGFGTGLNFLAAWQLFEESMQAVDCRAQRDRNDKFSGNTLLEFVSTEQNPLSKTEIQKALINFPELTKQLDQLLKHYPHTFEGHHFLPIMPGRIHLHLLIGNASQSLKNFAGQIDAWVFNDFESAKNTARYSTELFTEIAKLSHQSTTFSTPLTDPAIHEALELVGFKAQKTKSCHSLTGKYKKDTYCKIEAWYRFDNIKLPNDNKANIAIIGSGIAGCTTAWTLANSGHQVTIYDQHKEIASGASGNPLGLIRPLLTVDSNLSDQMLTQSALLTLRTIDTLKEQDHLITTQQGIVQTAHNDRLLKRYRNICSKRQLDFCHALEPSPLDIKAPCYQITAAALVNPIELCQAFVANCHDKVTVIHTKVTELSRPNDDWLLTTEHKIYQADMVILCTGAESIKVKQCEELPLKSTPGQISMVKTDTAHGIKKALCYEGYCLPQDTHCLLLGATYRQDNSSEPQESDHTENTLALSKILPNLAKSLSTSDFYGRVSYRSTSPDHLPLVGPIMSKNQFNIDFQALPIGNRYSNYPTANTLFNFILNIGHGSKGLSSSLLPAYLIDSLINKHCLPIPINVLYAIHPLRFFKRSLQSGT